MVRTETPHQGDSEPTLAADTVDGREGLLDWQVRSTPNAQAPDLRNAVSLSSPYMSTFHPTM